MCVKCFAFISQNFICDFRRLDNKFDRTITKWLQFIRELNNFETSMLEQWVRAITVHPDWVNFALYVQSKLFFSLRIGKRLIKFSAVLFQQRETKWRLVVTWCYETTDFYQLVGNENEEASQSRLVQYIHYMNCEKDFFEISVEYAVAYEKLLHLVKSADVIKVEFCEHRQTNILGQTNFQGYHVEIFSDGFQKYHFVLQQDHLSGKQVNFLNNGHYNKQSTAICNFRMKIFSSPICNQMIRRIRFRSAVMKFCIYNIMSNVVRST